MLWEDSRISVHYLMFGAVERSLGVIVVIASSAASRARTRTHKADTEPSTTALHSLHIQTEFIHLLKVIVGSPVAVSSMFVFVFISLVAIVVVISIVVVIVVVVPATFIVIIPRRITGEKISQGRNKTTSAIPRCFYGCWLESFDFS